MLKYDTGEVALQVAGWGGLTLYTEDERGGVPAERADDETDNFEPAPVAAKDVKGFALKLAQDLEQAHDFGVGFAADWDEIAQGDGVRALAVDAMRNAAYALDRLAERPEREAIAEPLPSGARDGGAAEPGAKMQDGVLRDLLHARRRPVGPAVLPRDRPRAGRSVLARLPAVGRELETRELEAGRDRAADEAVGAEAARRLPAPHGNNRPEAPALRSNPAPGRTIANRNRHGSSARADRPRTSARSRPHRCDASGRPRRP